VCAASFHLPSVSTANTNTVQHPTPHQQYETPTIPAVVISKVLLPQSNIMAAVVHGHSNIMAAFFTATTIFTLTFLQACQHKNNNISNSTEHPYCQILLTF
jgi:hypothetical protein